MAKTIRIREIVEKMSELYRDERSKVRVTSDELQAVLLILNQCEKDGGEHITVAAHERLKMKKYTLEQDKKLQEKYCDGIFMARELLMSLGFDTVVDMDE